MGGGVTGKGLPVQGTACLAPAVVADQAGCGGAWRLRAARIGSRRVHPAVEARQAAAACLREGQGSMATGSSGRGYARTPATVSENMPLLTAGWQLRGVAALRPRKEWAYRQLLGAPGGEHTWKGVRIRSWLRRGQHQSGVEVLQLPQAAAGVVVSGCSERWSRAAGKGCQVKARLGRRPALTGQGGTGA